MHPRIQGLLRPEAYDHRVSEFQVLEPIGIVTLLCAS